MKPELILAIETTHADVSMAIAENNEILANKAFSVKRGLAARIFPAVDDLLDSAKNITFADLTAILVNRGPGRYTGIRIGLAAVQGWQTALDIPAIGMDSFALLHHYAHRKLGADGQVSVLLPSVRQLVYLQSFDQDGRAIDRPRTISVDDLAAEFANLPDQNVITGGQLAGLDQIPSRHQMVEDPILPSAGIMVDCFHENRDRKSTSLEPLYIRQPDAIPPAPVFPSLQAEQV
jgi:tRNA threonylcarbamoyladenosine biosynthesis protein TsaB